MTTLEALLIEAIEPPQNRRREDEFENFEYLQKRDPEIERREKYRVMEEIRRKAGLF